MITKARLLWLAGLTGLFLIGSVMRTPGSSLTGAYSSPVSIMNTTSNPGSVLDANVATRTPYASTAQAGAQGCTATNECSYNFSPVPLGYRLVVEYIGGTMVIPTGNIAPPVGTLSYTPAFGGNAKWSATVNGFLGAGNNGSQYATFGQPMTAYIDPGTPTFFVFVGNGSASGTMELLGYLQNCSVSPCPSMQN